MKELRFSFSSIFLAALVVPVIVTYSISPGNPNYFHYLLIFIVLLVNFLLDILRIPEKRYYFYKNILLWTTLTLAVGGILFSVIISRHQVAPVWEVHDIILQQEAAIRFFLDGVNPYATTYFGTHLEAWHYSDTEINPALYHFVMQPLYLLFSIPFYGISLRTLGYFDGRIPLFFLYSVSLIVCFKVVEDREKKLTFVTLMALNPAMFHYIREGRSDFFMYGFFLVAAYLLTRGKNILSSIFMGLAYAVKQSIWPILPLYLAYLWFKTKSKKTVLQNLVALTAIFLIFALPFFLWNPKAFIDSTVLYLSGNTEHAYPISGYGVGMLLQQFGLIKDVHDKFPFTILQVILVLPLLYFLVKLIKKHTSVKMLIFTYGILIFVYWYLSRYFNNSHIAFISTVFITAYFWPDDKNNKS